MTTESAEHATVTLKVAASMDGSIATASGESQWITGEAAREEGHRLRASHDAILVGVGTLIADDPRLTCRVQEATARHPVPVVLDTTLRSPSQSKAFHGPKGALIYTGPGAHASDVTAEVIEVPLGASGGVCLESVLRDLRARGLGRVLVEGGSEVSRSFIEGGWVDVAHLYIAPKLIPGGKSWLGGDALESLSDAHQMQVLDVRRCLLYTSPSPRD